LRRWPPATVDGMADSETITVPRPDPGQALIVVTDADGASAWVTVKRTDLRVGSLPWEMLPMLEDAQRLLHERHDGQDAP
jgi:hypothetical protein